MTIKEARKQVGLTQEEFSDMFGIPLPNVRRWEQGNGNTPPWVEKLIIDKLQSMLPKDEPTLEEKVDALLDDEQARTIIAQRLMTKLFE